MKKNSGAALTSVVIVFLLVIMIGIPLLGTVMFNYRLRQYDSNIKEAEYINEMVMDKVASIIKSEVIAAIGTAKTNSQTNISSFSDVLINSYNAIYDDAYDGVNKFDGEATRSDEEIKADLKVAIEEELKDRLTGALATYESTGLGGISNTDIINVLEYSDDMTSVTLNEEQLQKICNKIFKENYYRILIEEYNLFEKIYAGDYKDLATDIEYGRNDFIRDSESNKIMPKSLRISVKYKGYEVYNSGENETKPDPTEAELSYLNNGIKVSVKSEFKLNDLTPLTYLSATYNIDCPELNAMSSIEQQNIALSNPTLDYALIADKGLVIAENGKLQVDGNLLAGPDSDGVGIKLNGGAELTEEIATTVKNGRIATAGDIILSSVSGKTTKLTSGSNPIYYRNLYLGEPNIDPVSVGTINVQFNGDVLAKDDLEINSNSTVTVNQVGTANYFGFNDKNDEGADSSSAIVINSSDISKLSINLGNLYLAGRAFIDGVKSTNRIDSSGNPIIYKTGESVSVKGNYIAYQTPLIGTCSTDPDPAKHGWYDVEKMKFSPYFMEGKKEGITANDDPESYTNIALSLVDNFISGSTSYKDFDSQEKWKYFKEYANINSSSVIKPNLKVSAVKYLEGIGFNNGSLVEQNKTTIEQNNMENKGTRFKEFTSYYGYVPVSEETGEISDKAKTEIKGEDGWLKFEGTTKQIKNGDFYSYVSKSGAGDATFDFNSQIFNGNENEKFQSPTINGIIIHDGNLTVKGNAGNIFTGVIITTGKLTIQGEVQVKADKDLTARVIIKNYLGDADFCSGGGNPLGEGALFKTFAYDDSGTTYSIINFVDDNSNMININELIGISDWEKQSYGRL